MNIRLGRIAEALVIFAVGFCAGAVFEPGYGRDESVTAANLKMLQIENEGLRTRVEKLEQESAAQDELNPDR